MDQDRLTVLNLYRLNGPSAGFRQAIRPLVDRVQAEGARGILSYRFFVDEAQGLARGVIDYAGPQAWIDHHDISMGWPEMQGLHRAATLAQVTFLGPLTPEIRAWIGQSTLTADILSDNLFVAGFQRAQG